MTTLLMVIVFVVEIIATPNFSRFCLRKYPKVSSDSIEKLHPKLNNVAFNYIPISIFTTFILEILSFIVFFKIGGLSFISLILVFGSLGASTTLFNGIYSLITNIYPAIYRYKWDDFVYDGDKNLRWIAEFQIGISILEIVTNIFVCYFFRG
jgi:hypothetical protein